jgi:hypothetical protein
VARVSEHDADSFDDLILHVRDALGDAASG